MDSSYIQKLVEISSMYYLQGMNQEQIAKTFGISRSAVSMLLTEAKNMGIVQVKINDPSSNMDELGRELESMFSLNKCIVVPSGTHKRDALLHITATQAVRYASSELITSHSSVGIAWGNTCRTFMEAFPEDTNLCDVTVVPLIGVSPMLTQEYRLNESIRVFADKMRGDPLFIYSPGLVDTLEDKRRIYESSFMQPILDRWKSLDCAILGIGSCQRRDGTYASRGTGKNCEAAGGNISDGKTLFEEICARPDMIVGDLCARQLSIKGEFANSDFNNKLIGVTRENLSSIRNVMAIAVGSNKVFAIIGALNTHLINVFVTDENTAAQVINLVRLGVLPK